MPIDWRTANSRFRVMIPVRKALGSMFWFLTYRFTAVPILLVAPAFALLGVLVPLGVYRSAARRTVVERLREAEQGG